MTVTKRVNAAVHNDANNDAKVSDDTYTKQVVKPQTVAPVKVALQPASGNSAVLMMLVPLLLATILCISLLTTQSTTLGLYKRFTIKYMTPQELRQYDGSDPTMPIYVSVKQHIFDVSSAPQFYSKKGNYPMFAGVDATRNYVTGCFAPERITYDTRGLTAQQYKQIEDWYKFYMTHHSYRHIGYLMVDKIDENAPLPDDDCHDFNQPS